MSYLSERIQKADWKLEKHVPVIEAPDHVKAGELAEIKVTLGKEIAHPNTTEHHIAWIDVYFQAEGEKNPHQVGHFEFSAHGEATAGPNQGPVYTHHAVATWIKASKPGTIYAVALCNIHGLWESSKDIGVTE
jgi:superoxide reductase